MLKISVIICLLGAIVMSEADSKEYKFDKTKRITELSEIQKNVTQKDGTEKPFSNEYWDNKKEGIYVDIISGEPLFSSQHKFKSGTGWPSFFDKIGGIKIKTDFKMVWPRKEVRSDQADSHLGHVFKDGPAPTGLRYCVNSASMKFIALEDLEKAGYGEFKKLFDKKE